MCFTLNNYTDDEYEKIKQKLTEWTVVYAIIGKEIGDNGTSHLQGFVSTGNKNRKTWTTWKSFIPRAHFEQAKRTDAENEKYCSKAGLFSTR